MDNYGLLGLQNFIFKKIKQPLFGTQKVGGADIQGIEERYIERLINAEKLAPKVHDKVVEKLTDAIAENIVKRIMAGASFEIEKNEK